MWKAPSIINRWLDPARNGVRAFSLTEVVLATGIIAFSLVVMVGLFGVVFDSSRKVTDFTGATAAVQRVDAALHTREDLDQNSLQGGYNFGNFQQLAKDVPADQLLFYCWDRRTSGTQSLDTAELTLATASRASSGIPTADVAGVAYAVRISPAKGWSSTDYADAAATGTWMPASVRVYAFSPGALTAGTLDTAGEVDQQPELPVAQFTTVILR